MTLFRQIIPGLCFLLIILQACAPSDEAPETKPTGPRPVVSMRVPNPNGSATVWYPGQVQPPIQTMLGFEHGGRIQDIAVHKGDAVQARMILARLDPTDDRLALKDKQADLTEVQARLEEASARYERIRALYETQNVSRQRLDQARAGYMALQAQLDAAQNGVHLARENLQDCLLRAPISGRVAAVPVQEYQMIQAGQPVIVLNSQEAVEVTTGVPEHLIGDITLSMPARVRFDALPEEVFPARVTEVGIESSPLSTYPVVLTLEEADPRLKAGMAAEVDLGVEEGTSGIFIPAQAVVGELGQKNAVWRVDMNSKTVHRHPVQVGAVSEQGVRILSGLSGGECIVLRGVHRLRQGMEVQTRNECGRSVSGQ